MNRLVVALFVVAACGGTSAPDTATPEGPGDGPADHEHAGEPVGQVPGDTASADAALAETPPDPAKVKADLLAAEQAAYGKARPVFDTYCATCHSKDGKKAKPKTLGHFDMTSYPFGGHHAMEVSAEVRKALGIEGGKATMPLDDPGAVQGDELALIAAWADAFDAAHAGGAHEGQGHDHGGGHKH